MGRRVCADRGNFGSIRKLSPFRLGVISQPNEGCMTTMLCQTTCDDLISEQRLRNMPFLVYLSISCYVEDCNIVTLLIHTRTQSVIYLVLAICECCIICVCFPHKNASCSWSWTVLCFRWVIWGIFTLWVVQLCINSLTGSREIFFKTIVSSILSVSTE